MQSVRSESNQIKDLYRYFIKSINLGRQISVIFSFFDENNEYVLGELTVFEMKSSNELKLGIQLNHNNNDLSKRKKEVFKYYDLNTVPSFYKELAEKLYEQLQNVNFGEKKLIFEHVSL